MIWLAWRLERSMVIALAAVGILVIGSAIVTGVIQHHYLVEFSHAPCFGKERSIGTSDRCGYLAVDISNVQTFDAFVRTAGFIIGPLVGAIVGLFAVVNELDQRTARFAWTQSLSRWRWFVAKVGAGALLTALILVPVAVTFSWWDGTTGDTDRIGRFAFEIAGWDLVAYGLFVFALTVLVGSVIRRTGWTLPVVVGLYLAVVFTFPTYVRPHLAPVTIQHSTDVQTGAPMPIDSLQIRYGMFPRSDHGPFTESETQATDERFTLCLNFKSGQTFTEQTKDEAQCFRRLDLWTVSVYIANDQFWTLQLYEGFLYLGASLILVGGAYVLVRRVEP